MKLCTNCVHFHRYQWIAGHCDIIRHPDDGEPAAIAAIMRSPRGETDLYPGTPICGPNATLFQQRPLTLWERFFGRPADQ